MVFSKLHSAEARATVNEHIEIAKKKEMPRVSAQGVSARWCGKSTSRANQNAGSGARGPLLGSGKRTGDLLASKTTLNAKNLEALGAERVVETDPTMGGEDFGRLGGAGPPILMLGLGTVAPERLAKYAEQSATPSSSARGVPSKASPTGTAMTMARTEESAPSTAEAVPATWPTCAATRT